MQHKTQPAPVRLNNEREQAAALNISLRSLQNYREMRLIPHIRLGRRVLYNHADVMRALERLTIKAL